MRATHEMQGAIDHHGRARHGVQKARVARRAATGRRRRRAPSHEVLVTCALHSPRFVTALLAIVALPWTSIGAQQPPPPVPSPVPASASSPALMSYRPPAIALVQPLLPPAGTGSVPRDRPAVVFRFAAGEPDDPLDARS